MPTIWPRETDCPRFYGAIGSGHTKIEVPYAMFYDNDGDGILEPGERVRFITVHSKCSVSALRVLQKVAAVYTENDRHLLGLDNFSGCYNPRRKRGGSEWSIHAYAAAMDFDQGRNQLRWSGKPGAKPRARLSHPDAEAFWKAWEAEGWLSLGRARDFDWMHVQAARL